MKIKSEDIESKVEFNSIVIGTEKYKRVYRVKLQEGKDFFSVLDYSLKYYAVQIRVGDSLIKRKGTTCYEYRRNGQLLVENCEGVFKQ